jgi:hypothetical protein
MAQHVVIHHPHARRRIYVDRERGEERVGSEAWLRSQFGGFSFGSAFFGWVVASGVGVLLTALLAAAGSAVALTSIQNGTAQAFNGTVSTVGFVSGLLLLIAFAISYYAGGYVAGRLARFDGMRQGVGVWAIGVIVALLLGAAGAAFGARYNLLQAINLPHLPINQGAWTTAGAVTLILILAVTLIASIVGAQAGVQYHEQLDEAARAADE